MRIIVTEFPKSGGSWLTSILADTLGIPARDIYHDDNFKTFDLTNHPWYRGASSWNLTESCVIKSHESVGSKLHNFPAHTLHLLRDGRDVVVSKYFFDKDFQVKNKIAESFPYTFEAFLEMTARSWTEYVSAWSDQDVLQVTYEELLGDPSTIIQKILANFGISVTEEQIFGGIRANTKEKFREKLSVAFEHNTFVRKGVSGDWKNHFTREHRKQFHAIAGNTLIRLGYEKDSSWVNEGGLLSKLKQTITGMSAK